jgi:hypothetical protein
MYVAKEKSSGRISCMIIQPNGWRQLLPSWTIHGPDSYKQKGVGLIYRCFVGYEVVTVALVVKQVQGVAIEPVTDYREGT